MGGIRRFDVGILGATALALVVLAGHGLHAGIPDSPHHALEGAGAMAVMMVPLVATSAGIVAERSLRRRRLASVAEHTAGFAAIWFVAAMVAVAAVWVGTRVASLAVVFACAAAVTIGWQLSPWRLRLVDRRSRLRVSAPTGWRADVGALGSGARQAATCVRTCWAAMLTMAAAPVPAVMTAVLVPMLWEWAPGRNPFGRRRRGKPAIAYAALLPIGLLLAR